MKCSIDQKIKLMSVFIGRIICKRYRACAKNWSTSSFFSLR